MKRIILIGIFILSLCGCAVTHAKLPVPVMGPDGKITGMQMASVDSYRLFMQVGLSYNPVTGLTYGSDASTQMASMMQIMAPLINMAGQMAAKYYTGQTVTGPAVTPNPGATSP